MEGDERGDFWGVDDFALFGVVGVSYGDVFAGEEGFACDGSHGDLFFDCGELYAALFGDVEAGASGIGVEYFWD